MIDLVVLGLLGESIGNQKMDEDIIAETTKIKRSELQRGIRYTAQSRFTNRGLSGKLEAEDTRALMADAQEVKYLFRVYHDDKP